MLNLQGSAMLSWIESKILRLKRLAKRSRLLSPLPQIYPRLERVFARGCLGSCGEGQAHVGRHFRLLRAGESSRILGAWRAFLAELLATELSSFGIFGVLGGIFLAAVCLITPPATHFYSSLLLSLILSVLSVPLLQSHRSLDRAMRGSFFIGGLLYGLCGISDIRLFGVSKSQAHPWLALLFALLIALIGIWIPPFFLFLTLAILPILILLYAVPEATATGVLLVFPFLHLTAHPTTILIAAVLLINLAWLPKALCGRRPMRFGVLDFSVALLMLSFLLGGLVGAGGEERLVGGAMIAVFISSWFPAVSLFSAHVWRTRAIGAIKISSFFCSAYGIWQYFLGGSALRWVDESRFSDIGSRVVGCFQNPNVLAIFLLLTAPFSLAHSLDQHRQPRVRFLNFLAFSTIFLCLILTWSRGAWLGILCAFLLCQILSSRRSAASLILSLPLLACAVPFLPSNVLRRFLSIGSFADSSIRYRLYTWRGVLRMIADHPWGIGVGEHAFRAVYPHYALSGIESVMHPHQLLLQILVELGVIGLLIFLSFLILLLFCSLHLLCRAIDASHVDRVAAAAALAGALVMGLFDALWYQPGICLLFFAVGAILTAQSDDEWRLRNEKI